MSVLARTVGYSPKCSLFLPQQHPEGVRHSELHPDMFWSEKTQISGNLQYLFFYSQPRFLSEGQI